MTTDTEALICDCPAKNMPFGRCCKLEPLTALRAGFVDWYPGPKGGVIPVPRSISYARLEQGDMEQFHDAAVAFLRSEHAGRTLWSHLSERQRIDMIETILGGFRE